MTDPAPSSVTIRARGLAFPALVAGPEGGTPVLCLHGFPDTRHGFFPRSGPSLGALLAAAGHRVVAPAMRGTEPSCLAPDGDYSPGALCDDVLALVDALGGRAYVVGNDWGAFATYLAAAAAPERFAGAVTLGIPHPNAVRWTPRMAWSARHMLAFLLQKRTARSLPARDFALLERLYRRWSPSWRAPGDALDEVKAAYRQPGVIEGALAPYAATPRHFADVRRRLRDPIRVPTLALFGGSDPSIPPATYERARGYFASSYHHDAVPGVGHFVHREDPTGVFERVNAFVASTQEPSR